MSRFARSAAVAVYLLMSSFASAQGDGATLSGRITDQTGVVLVSAQVQVINVDTGLLLSTLTNSDGVYVIPDLRSGPYRVAVEKEGFRKIVLTDLILNVQDAIGRNFTMQIGQRNELITITAGREELNLSPAVSTVADQQFVENMPLNGRSFQSLIYLTPGLVLTTSSQDAPGQFSVNGQRSNANYFMVDGVSADFGSAPASSIGQAMAGTTPALTAAGGTNSLVSVDAMQEFRIQTSSYAPEFGRMPGAQISIVTKGGGNQWHGTAFDYIRNDLFDARNWFNNAQPENGNPAEPKPPLRQNNFGGTFGGPIWRDHTFLFFSYEGLRLRLPNTEDAYFLTPASRANVSAVWAPIVAGIPVPDANAKLLDPSCDNITIPCNGEINAAYSDPSSFNVYGLRVDHTLTKKITLFARYNHAPSTLAQNSFAQVQHTTFNTDTLTAGMTMALSPAMVNDFRANWSRATGFLNFTLDTFHGATVPSPSVLYPPGGFNLGNAQAYFGICLDGCAGGGLVQTGTRDKNTQRQLNFVDTLSNAVGAHQLKFGVDFRRMKPTTSTDNGDDIFVFGWPALKDGTVDQLLTGASTPITAHTYNWSLFGQDTWKITPRLTLTYGLRWEINTPPVSDVAGSPLYAVQGIFDSNPFQLAPAGTPLWHTQYSAFAPRIGAAYQITPKTVVRGGFGLFYDLGYGADVSYAMGGTFPYLRENFVNGDDSKGNPVLPLNLSLPVYQPLPFSTTITANALTVDAVDLHLRLPVTYEWNAAFERELGTNQTITATYVGANGQNLLRKDNIVPPGSVFAGGAGLVVAMHGNGYSHYNALQLQFMRRMSHGLQALVSYSLAKSSDIGSDDMGGYYATSVNTVVLPALSPSDFDTRNTFSAALSYQIPAPAWGKVSHAALGGWALDGVFRASTGPPVNVQIDGIDPGIGFYTTQADLVPGEPIWISMPSEPAGKALNPFAFTLPTFPAQGNFPRNGIRSPYGIDQTDLALRRRFNITERVKLDFRAEFFNLFNHPMFGGYGFAPYSIWGLCNGNTPASCPTPIIAPPGPGVFGRVWPGNTLNVGLGGGGLNGGQSPLYAPGGPRSGQLALKLTF